MLIAENVARIKYPGIKLSLKLFPILIANPPVPRVPVHLAEGKPKVSDVLTEDLQPIVVPWGPGSSNLSFQLF